LARDYVPGDIFPRTDPSQGSTLPASSPAGSFATTPVFSDVGAVPPVPQSAVPGPQGSSGGVGHYGRGDKHHKDVHGHQNGHRHHASVDSYSGGLGSSTAAALPGGATPPSPQAANSYGGVKSPGGAVPALP
jgi:hypothetical protein